MAQMGAHSAEKYADLDIWLGGMAHPEVFSFASHVFGWFSFQVRRRLWLQRAKLWLKRTTGPSKT